MTRELSGDIRLSPADRIRYLLYNACRNLCAACRGPRSRPFIPDVERVRALAGGQSPSRLLTELFLEAELPRLVTPRNLTVLELGCGSGSMVIRLARLGYCGRYIGVDIQNRFRSGLTREIPFDVEFVQVDARTFTPLYPIDLTVSVSTLEHIPSDADLIGRLPMFFRPGGVEVHVVPSGASLAVYLWHGFRQYTPAILAAKFGARIEIVRLGGLASFLLHFMFITLPELVLRRSLRHRVPRIYRSLLLRALRIDMFLPVFPSAYVAIRRH